MTQFFLTSTKPPEWDEGKMYILVPSIYSEKLRDQWSNIKMNALNDDTYCLRWEIVRSSKPGLTGALRTDGKAVTISANPRDQMIQFALWHRTVIPEEYPLFLFDEGLNVVVELQTNTTVEDLQAGLS